MVWREIRTRTRCSLLQLNLQAKYLIESNYSISKKKLKEKAQDIHLNAKMKLENRLSRGCHTILFDEISLVVVVIVTTIHSKGVGYWGSTCRIEHSLTSQILDLMMKYSSLEGRKNERKGHFLCHSRDAKRNIRFFLILFYFSFAFFTSK